MLRQRRVPFLGEIMDALYTSLPILSIINFLSITVSLYITSKPYIDQYLPWLNIGLFFLILFLVSIIFMFIVYKFIIPSLWAFRGEQMSGQNGKLDEILKEIKELKNSIER